MRRMTAIFMMMLMVMSVGCATAYVAVLRSEYSESGKVCGVYYGDSEYPRIYPSLMIATCIEIPTWWWISETDIGRGYEAWLWPIGAPLSLVDVFVSCITDTVMIPYDYNQIRKKSKDES